LPAGTWVDPLERISAFSDRVFQIVTSRLADKLQWAEALNRGAYDVLRRPFEAGEVIRVLNMASLRWMLQR